VEVKTRRSDKFGSPEEAINFNKQQKIIKNALCYLAKYVN
jgi:putative endonuclease